MSRGVNEHETTNTRTKQQRTQRNHKHKEATTKRRFKHLKEPKKAPKRSQEHPKTTPKRAEEGKRSDLEPQDDKRTEPRRFQDRLGPPRALQTPVWCHPWGSIWEAKSAPKRNQKRSQNEAKIEESTNPDPRRSWTRLGSILGRFGCSLGALETLQTLCLPMFREHSLFRR